MTPYEAIDVRFSCRCYADRPLETATLDELNALADNLSQEGDLLITADLDEIVAAGKPTATMVIVTNTDDYASVTPELGAVKAGDKLVTVAK